MSKFLKHPINHNMKQTPKGGMPQQRTGTHQGKPSTKPGKASARGSMITGPYGGKRPA